MSKLIVVSVADSKVGGFMTPMFFQTKGQAVRSFQDAVNEQDVKNEFFKHAEDFNLFLVAEYETESGVFLNSDVGPILLLAGASAAAGRNGGVA